MRLPNAERAVVDIAKLRDSRLNPQHPENTPVKLLDVVAMLEDKPSEGLVAGQVGTVSKFLLPASLKSSFLTAKAVPALLPS